MQSAQNVPERYLGSETLVVIAVVVFCVFLMPRAVRREFLLEAGL